MGGQTEVSRCQDVPAPAVRTTRKASMDLKHFKLR